MSSILRKNTANDLSSAQPSSAATALPQETGAAEGDFASLLDTHLQIDTSLKPGDKVRATVVAIGDEWIFVAYGGKSEGSVAREELTGKDGRLLIGEGDTLEVFFLAQRHNTPRFTTRIGGGDTSTNDLQEAFQNGIPVEGQVAEEIKGGYLVSLGKIRAFCPFSQIGMRRPEESPVGLRLQFKITEIKQDGKSVVLSRRQLLEEEQRQKMAELRQHLAVGQTVAGTVTSIRDFGAFVDIGGLEGLVPTREVSWDSGQAVGDLLAAGDRIEVEILALDWQEQRFTFSLKRAAGDPWDSIDSLFAEGASVDGTVSRLMPFGAFVRLAPGIEGLVHISRLGGRKLNHPREALEDGQPLKVRIEKIDRENRRISLAPVEPGQLKNAGQTGAEAEQDADEAEVAAYFADRRQEKGDGMTMKELFQKAAASKKK